MNGPTATPSAKFHREEHERPMNAFICITCGTQYPPSNTRPARCQVCEDERQYVNWQGQEWTAMDRLGTDHRNVLRDEEPGLTGIRTEPEFAIGQRALLVQTAQGNILWDSISYLDDATIEAVRRLGGISAITISHPHFYSSMVEWARAFDAPVRLHAANRAFVQRPDAAIEYWEGDTLALNSEVTLIRCGGHFPGSTVLHWAAGAGGRGVLLTGDTIYVVSDRRYASFMFSYPNLIPLPVSAVRGIISAIEPFASTGFTVGGLSASSGRTPSRPSRVQLSATSAPSRSGLRIHNHTCAPASGHRVEPTVPPQLFLDASPHDPVPQPSIGCCSSSLC